MMQFISCCKLKTRLANLDFDERANKDVLYDGNPQAQGVFDADATIIDIARWPLIPINLTRAQMELLLELEWAHRAMIQSYVISVIDNASLGCYEHLTTLTIAKIPSCHLRILQRDDLWASIPSLKSVHLGVIADWRRITKPTPGCIEDSPISPLGAVGAVFALLQDHISQQPHVESIHFEWICGGEFAPSSHQRNQYVLLHPLPSFLS